jgi:2-polyprenyl-6-methoxyphenol hydroxylase-like FAD-dependent oxidoreductase
MFLSLVVAQLACAVRLSQLGQSCTIVEQNSYTTIHPKMEYTSHRTMEIYRRIGLIDHFKSKAVPETYGFAELFATGIGGRNLHVATIVCYYIS